jgi:hypothetical protein
MKARARVGVQTRWLLSLVLAVAAASAGAHDTWLRFDDASATPAELSSQQLLLTTGTRFPRGESGHAPDSLRGSGCVDAAGQGATMEAVATGVQALRLAVKPTPHRGAALACWALTGPHEVSLTPALVEVYFREIRPSAEVRTAWRQQQAQGLPWRERYRKQARVERAGAASWEGASLRSLRKPTGRWLEILPLGEQPLAVGVPLAFQVLLEGEPVAGLAVELVSERNPLGVWRSTDGQGRLVQALPFGGHWLLRATRVAPLAPGADVWESDFATLMVELP